MFKPAANIQGCLIADAPALSNVLSVDANTWAYLNNLLTPGDWTYVKIGEAPNCEVVRVDGAAGSTLQVSRGFDGTNPTAYSAGTDIAYTLCEAAIVDIITANPTAAAGISISGVGSVTVEQIATNQFQISVEELALTSDGTIDVIGSYPNIQLGTSSAANGCCG